MKIRIILIVVLQTIAACAIGSPQADQLSKADTVVISVFVPIIYVDSTVVGGDGQTWGTAFDNLQDALAIAVLGDEIWVSQGTYYPDEGGPSPMDNDQTATFTLIDGVSIYGGFNATETFLSERDPKTNVTILSGDIDGDDTNDDGNNIAETINDILNNNSYNILIGSNVDMNTVLDGFTITAGNGTSIDTINKRGAGIYCGNNASGPSLNQIMFVGNWAIDRGAATFGCTQLVTNSSFINNRSGDLAGAVYAFGGLFENVEFEGNVTTQKGGAIRNGIIPIVIKNTKFIANKSTQNQGGGLYSRGDTTLDNVLFIGNKAGISTGDSGGALMMEAAADAILTNVTMTGNRAADLGGAIASTSTGTLEIRNSIIWNNQDVAGQGTLSASINNSLAGGITTITNSLVQDSGGSISWDVTVGIDGGNNTDEDPLFTTDSDPTMAPTSVGDAHLMRISTAIDAGDDSVVTALFDLDGDDRIKGAAVDMGAYEFFEEQVFKDGFE